MGRSVRRLATALAIAGSLAACGGSNSSPNGGSGGSNGNHVGGSGGIDGGTDPELQAFCESLTALSRSRAQRCSAMPASVAQSYIPDLCPNLSRAVSSGKMSFSAADTPTCLTDLTNLACEADVGPASCDQALSGTVAGGAACGLLTQSQLFFTECQVGSTCIAGSNPCTGTCVKRALLGQHCGSGVGCVAGETCSAATQTCTTKGGANTPCGLDSSPECQAGFSCSDMIGGTCTALLAAGQSCGSSAECLPPLACDRGFNITGTCKQALKVGDPCTIDEFQCDTGLGYCGSDSKCHARPGLGQPCDITDGEGTSCVLGTCDTAANPAVCKAFATGEACSINADCGPNALCAMDTTTFTVRCTASCL
jgi:hypothetical protein